MGLRSGVLGLFWFTHQQTTIYREREDVFNICGIKTL